MLPSVNRSLKIPGASVLILLLCHSTAGAQEQPRVPIPQVIEDLVSRASTEIENRARSSRKPWTVMVTGFPERQQLLTELGEDLADDFTAAMAEHPGAAKLLDRACLKQPYASEPVTSAIYADVNYQDWRAGRCGATHRIDGFITTQGNQVQLTVSLIDQANEGELFEANVSWPLVSAFKELLLQPVPSFGTDVTSTKPFSFTLGKGRPPECKQCREPETTRAASQNHYTGTIVFRATITASGRIDDLFVVRAAPYGMTEQAFKAVHAWTFTPALDDQGKPTAARIPIEITTKYGAR
jgi:TonB family protein